MSVKKRFDMHQILNYRVELERLCKQEFALAKQNLESASELLVQERRSAEQLASEFVAKQDRINSVVEMQLYADFFARKREDLKEHQRRVEMLDRVLEDHRTELQQATKEKKVMERLKEKQEAAFRKEQSHKEGLLLDELSVQKKGKD